MKGGIIMTNTKITKTMKFDMLLAIDEVANNEMLVEFINHEKELIKKKSKSGSDKPTKRQIENKEVVEPAILEFLATVEKATATEITNNINVDNVSVPRISAILKKLIESKKVVRLVIKGTPYFSIV